MPEQLIEPDADVRYVWFGPRRTPLEGRRPTLRVAGRDNAAALPGGTPDPTPATDILLVCAPRGGARTNSTRVPVPHYPPTPRPPGAGDNSEHNTHYAAGRTGRRATALPGWRTTHVVKDHYRHTCGAHTGRFTNDTTACFPLACQPLQLRAIRAELNPLPLDF